MTLGNLQNDIMNHWSLILIRLLREILYSLKFVIDKYIMEKKFCSIYELTGFIGIFLLVFSVIFSLLNYYYFKIDDFNEYINNLSILKILIDFAFTFIQLALCFSIFFTIKNNTTCHIYIISIFIIISNNIMNFSENTIITIICLVFILFMSLVFNEIIEINCFGLSDNTKRNIMKRERNDDLMINEDLSDDDKTDKSKVIIQFETFDDNKSLSSQK